MICLLASLLTVSTEAVTDAKPPSHTTMVVTSNACFPQLSRVVSGILLNSPRYGTIFEQDESGVEHFRAD